MKHRDRLNRKNRLDREADPEKWQGYWRKTRYAMHPSEFAKIFRTQKGLCAICQKPETKTRLGKLRALCVDHDHVTGRIRGLLCSNCNTAIGMLHDSTRLLESAISYLS